MKGNLLWVYEGLTEYLGDVLAARSGIWNAPIYRDRLATYAATYNNERPGRNLARSPGHRHVCSGVVLRRRRL